MTERLSLPELESHLWGAAIILRGLVDAGDYKQFIFPLLFYKRLSDVWDEEYNQAFTESDEKHTRLAWRMSASSSRLARIGRMFARHPEM